MANGGVGGATNAMTCQRSIHIHRMGVVTWERPYGQWPPFINTHEFNVRAEHWIAAGEAMAPTVGAITNTKPRFKNIGES